jgi:hypothetical protein
MPWAHQQFSELLSWPHQLLEQRVAQVIGLDKRINVLD